MKILGSTRDQSQGIIKVIRVHSLGTVNIFTKSCRNLSNRNKMPSHNKWAQTHRTCSKAHKKDGCSFLYWASASAAKHPRDRHAHTHTLSQTHIPCVAPSLWPLSLTPSGCPGDTEQTVQPVSFAWFRSAKKSQLTPKTFPPKKEWDTHTHKTRHTATHTVTKVQMHAHLDDLEYVTQQDPHAR